MRSYKSSKTIFCIFLTAAAVAAEKISLRGEQRRKLNAGTVTQLELIDAQSNLKVMDLDPNSVNTVNLHALGLNLTAKFNINALVNDGFDEVLFDNGETEGSSPYARCGNTGDIFDECDDLEVDAFLTVSATSVDSLGNPISTLSATIEIIENTPSPTFSMVPTTAPTLSFAPSSSSAPSGACPIPQFVGEWEEAIEYPLNVAEAQGAMIGDDFVIIGGFHDGFDNVTEQNYARNVSDPVSEWRKLDDIPVAGGITHAGFVVIERKFYMCGGYIGGAPGPQTDVCLIYDHDAPAGSQWSYFTPLPEARGGGAMVYSKEKNSLIFSAGAVRPNPGRSYTVDSQDTWMISLDPNSVGWVKKEDIPFKANHVGFVTAFDDLGKEHHFFLGGHEQQNKKDGYVSDNYEWDAELEKFIQRKPMMIPGGHISSSTRPIGCGFVIAAGSTNLIGKISDVYYYDIPRDTWTFIGNIPKNVNTPVCDFGTDGYFYCETGLPGRSLSYRRRLVAY